MSKTTSCVEEKAVLPVVRQNEAKPPMLTVQISTNDFSVITPSGITPWVKGKGRFTGPSALILWSLQLNWSDHVWISDRDRRKIPMTHYWLKHFVKTVTCLHNHFKDKEKNIIWCKPYLWAKYCENTSHDAKHKSSGITLWRWFLVVGWEIKKRKSQTMRNNRNNSKTSLNEMHLSEKV